MKGQQWTRSGQLHLPEEVKAVSFHTSGDILLIPLFSFYFPDAGNRGWREVTGSSLVPPLGAVRPAAASSTGSLGFWMLKNLARPAGGLWDDSTFKTGPFWGVVHLERLTGLAEH